MILNLVGTQFRIICKTIKSQLYFKTSRSAQINKFCSELLLFEINYFYFHGTKNYLILLRTKQLPTQCCVYKFYNFLVKFPMMFFLVSQFYAGYFKFENIVCTYHKHDIYL